MSGVIVGRSGVSENGMRDAGRSGLTTGLAVLVGALVVHGALQFWLGGLPDRDGWFHGRLAALIASGDAPWHGLDFPWLTHSAYADRPMDWSLLWHLLLTPFVAALGPITGLKAFAALQAALLTTAFYAVLRRLDVKAALAWTVLLLAASPQWLFRLHFGRPTPFVVATLLIVLDLVIHRRDRAAAVAIALSLLVYQVPAPVVMVAGAAWLGRWTEDGRPDWRAAATLAAGGVAGVLVHPGLWTGGTFNIWELMRGSLAVAAAGGEVALPGGDTLVLPLPRELGSPGLMGLMTELWLPLVATLAAVGCALRARRDSVSVATALLAVVGLAGTLRSGRFFEYWHVLALLAAAVAISGRRTTGSVRAHTQLIGLAALLLGASTLHGLAPLVHEHGSDAGADVRPGLAAISARADPGDVVWHASWDDFAPLFHFAPRLRYVTGMDPWWLVAHDPEDARAYALAGAGHLDDASLHEALTGRFGARFALIWTQAEDGPDGARVLAGISDQLRAAKWAEVLHEDDRTVAFELKRR